MSTNKIFSEEMLIKKKNMFMEKGVQKTKQK